MVTCVSPYPKVVKTIGSTTVIVEPPGGTDVLDIQEMYEVVEKNRMDIVEVWPQHYTSRHVIKHAPDTQFPHMSHTCQRMPLNSQDTRDTRKRG